MIKKKWNIPWSYGSWNVVLLMSSVFTNESSMVVVWILWDMKDFARNNVTLLLNSYSIA